MRKLSNLIESESTHSENINYQEDFKESAVTYFPLNIPEIRKPKKVPLPTVVNQEYDDHPQITKQMVYTDLLAESRLNAIKPALEYLKEKRKSRQRLIGSSHKQKKSHSPFHTKNSYKLI